MSYTLYYAPDCANLAVRMALEEMDMSYNEILVDRSANAQQSASYLALNPQGLIPVLLDPGQDEPLFETAAILLHLADQHQTLKPKRAQSRGQCLKWLFFISNTLHADLRGLFYTQRYINGEQALVALRLGLQDRVRSHFRLIEDTFTQHGGPWLLGAELSICDLYLACCARWAMIYPRDFPVPAVDVAGLPRLGAMLRQLEQRKGIGRALSREGLTGEDGCALSAPHLPAP